MPEQPDTPTRAVGWLPRLAWLPIPLLLAAMLVLWAADLRTPHESPLLVTVCNFVFSTVASLLVVVLVGRSFLASGEAGLLVLGCGVLIWGIGGLSSSALLLRYGVNAAVTIHNSLACLAALCHLSGALLARRPHGGPRLPGSALALAHAGGLCLVWLVVVLTLEGRLPVFFVQGQGGTPIRQLVLGAAVAMFGLTAVVLWRSHRVLPSAFVRWYGAALLLVATGLLGVMLHPVVGGVLGWTGRAALYLGGVYMLMAAIASVRESGLWGVSLSAALRGAEARFRKVFDHAATGIAITDCAGRFVQCNAAYCRLTGYSQAELAEMAFPALIHPDDREQNLDQIRQLLAGDIPSFETENRYLHRDGRSVWVHKHVSLLRDDRNQPTHVVALVTDMTERRRTEDVLRFLGRCGVSSQGEGFFRELARYLAQTLDMDFVCIDRLAEGSLSAQTLAVYHNGQFEDNVSYRLADTPCGAVVGQRICCFPRHVRALFPRDTVLQDLQAEGYLGTTLWSAQGTPIGLIAIISRRPLADSRLAEAVLALVAVRAAGELERRQAEDAVRASEERFRVAFDGGAVPMTLTRPDGQVLRANAALCQMLGYSEAALLGRSLFDFAHPDDQSAIRTGALQLLDGVQSALRLESRYLRQDGKTVWGDLSAAVVRDADRRPLYMVTHVQDVSKRKAAVQALRASAERLRLALQAGAMATWDWHLPSDTVVWNHEHYRLLGYEVGAVQPSYRAWADRVHPDDVAAVEAALRQSMERGSEYAAEFRVLAPAAPVRWLEARGKVDLDGRGKPVRSYGVMLDITGRKQAQEDLRRASVAALNLLQDAAAARQTAESIGAELRVREEQLRLFVDHAPAAIAMFDHEMRYVAVSQRWLADFGLSGQELTGRCHYDVFPEIPERWREIHRRCLAGEVVRADEDPFDRADGSRQWLRWEIRPWRSAPDTIGGIIICSDDITERRRRDERLRTLNRALNALGHSGQALMRATSEADFLAAACRIVREDCGYAMVWIGVALDDDAKSILPVAHAGFEDGYLDTLQLSWADCERGRGPTGTAVRTGQVCRCLDMLADPAFLPWREQARRRGYASSVALPLLAGGRAFGALTIYAREPVGFTDEEVNLLTDLATGFAQGVTALRTRAAQERAEQAVQRLNRDLEERVRERTAELRVSEGRLRRLAAQFATAQDEEQQRLAEALHDDVAQVLAAASVKLAVAAQSTGPAIVARCHRELQALLEEANEKVRLMSFELGTATLYRLGLDEAVRELGESMEERHGIRIAVTSDGEGTRLDSAAAVVLYKAVRELLFNVVKHAGASEAAVSIRGGDGQLTVAVQDRGRGFSHPPSTAGVSAGTGLGLFGIRERVGDLGGTVLIESEPGVRTCITLAVPLAEAPGAGRPAAAAARVGGVGGGGEHGQG